MRVDDLLELLDGVEMNLPIQDHTAIHLGEMAWSEKSDEELLHRWMETDTKIFQILESFAQNGQWPPMNDEEALFVYWRVTWARKALELLRYVETSLSISIVDLEKEALFEYILRQVWASCGIHYTVDKLWALSRGARS